MSGKANFSPTLWIEAARVAPSKKSEQRVRDRLREIMNRGTTWRWPAEAVGEMNQVLRGWGGYFYYGHPQRAMGRVNHFAEQRVRKWLMRKFGQRGPGYKRFPTATIYKSLGLYRLPTTLPARGAQASR